MPVKTQCSSEVEMKDQQKLQYIANRLKAKIGEECGPLKLMAIYEIGWNAFTFIAWSNGILFSLKWVHHGWIKGNDQWIDDRIIEPMSKLWIQSEKKGTYPEITRIHGGLFVSAE